MGLLGMGRVAQYFHSSTGERVYHVMLRAHPSARPQGLQHGIARHLVGMARELESEAGTQPADRVRVLTYVFDSQTSSVEAWEELGLRRVRTGWTMARGLLEPVEEEPAPEGVILRTYRYPEDNEQALQAFNSALANYYDFHPVSQSAWDREMGAPYSRPDLSWLAFSEGDRDRAIGVAGCQVNESQNEQAGRLEGWIEGIGVVPDFRGRGIGKALLSRCLQSLRDAGLETALADVDSESTAAVGLFQGAGFAARSALMQYECALEEIRL
ncbi:MAG: GNAT family N-acetyltransferase [Chloroflexia bacterium]